MLILKHRRGRRVSHPAGLGTVSWRFRKPCDYTGQRNSRSTKSHQSPETPAATDALPSTSRTLPPSDFNVKGFCRKFVCTSRLLWRRTTFSEYPEMKRTF